MDDQPTFPSIIANRGFRSLWINQILVQLSYNAINFALIIWVFKLVGTNLAVATLMLAIYSPVIIFGLFAGVFVDIADRKKIIIAIDLLLAVGFFLLIFIKGSYLLILIDTFLINSLAQFFMPSESSSIPMLVSKKQLFLANSLFSLTFFSAFIVGYSISGPILNSLGIRAVFIFGTIMLLVASLLAQNLPSIKVAKVNKKFENFLSLSNFRGLLRITKEETTETFRFIRGRLGVLVAISILAVLQGVVGILAVLLPSYLERVLHIHATDSSYFMMIPLGIGMVIGALVGGRWFYNLPRRYVVIPAIIGAGLIFILIGATPVLAHLFQSPEIPLYTPRPRYFSRAPSLASLFALGAVILGFCTVSIMIPCQTVLQESTSEKNRGKIFATLSVIMTSVAAIPTLLAGLLSDSFGAAPIFFSLGLMIFIFGILAYQPAIFFKKHHLPQGIRQFLGSGHWKEEVV